MEQRHRGNREQCEDVGRDWRDVARIRNAKIADTHQMPRESPGTDSQKYRSHGGYQQGRRGRKMGGKVPGIRSINGRYKIDRARLRILWEMEKPKNVYVRTTHGHELRGGNTGGRAVPGGGGYRGEKNVTTVTA